MTDDDVHSAVVQWVRAKTGIITIKDHPGVDGPNRPYIMVNLTGTVEVRDHEQAIEYEEADTGDIDTGDTYPDVTARPVIETEWRFSVHAYGLEPIDPATKQARSPRPTVPTDILRPIVAASKLTQAMEPMFPQLVVHEVSQIRSVPDWINNAWQPRGQMDLFIRGLTRDGIVVEVIEEGSIVVEKTNP